MKTVIVFISCLLAGCSTMSAKRDLLPGNIFNSKHPDLIVKFDESLAYKGTFEIDTNSSSDRFMVSTRKEKEYHIWTDHDGKVGAAIVFSKLPKSDNSFWYANIFKKDDPRAFRILKEGSFQTRVGLLSIDEKEDKWLNKMDLDFSNLNMAKIWAKLSSSKTRIMIIYAEKYISKDSLTIDQFVSRADSHVHILEN